MTPLLVVDSSAICALCFDDEATPASDLLLEQLEPGGVWVPSLFLWEVANVLLIAERRQRISQAERVEALQLLTSLDLQLSTLQPLWSGTTASSWPSRPASPVTTRRIWNWRCASVRHWRHAIQSSSARPNNWASACRPADSSP